MSFWVHLSSGRASCRADSRTIPYLSRGTNTTFPHQTSLVDESLLCTVTEHDYNELTLLCFRALTEPFSLMSLSRERCCGPRAYGLMGPERRRHLLGDISSTGQHGRTRWFSLCALLANSSSSMDITMTQIPASSPTPTKSYQASLTLPTPQASSSNRSSKKDAKHQWR